jgi:ubiquinone/menaquinone biosynthesis C-methylase UbiE
MSLLEQKSPDAWSRYYGSEFSWRWLRMNLTGHLPFFRWILWPRPRRVLEVGTGTATMAALISFSGSRVTSVDIERPILDQAQSTLKRLHSPARLLQADAFNLPFPTGSFDVAFSQGFLEHFDDDEIRALLREQARVARKVVFSVPNESYGVQDFGNERLMPREQWERIVQSSGLQLVKSYDYAPLRGRKRHLPVHYLAVVNGGGFHQSTIEA